LGEEDEEKYSGGGGVVGAVDGWGGEKVGRSGGKKMRKKLGRRGSRSEKRGGGKLSEVYNRGKKSGFLNQRGLRNSWGFFIPKKKTTKRGGDTGARGGKR